MCERGRREPQPIYLFLVSNFRSRGPHQKLLFAPRVPSEGLACSGLWFPILSSLPSPCQELWALMGLQGMNILNYSPLSRDRAVSKMPHFIIW